VAILTGAAGGLGGATWQALRRAGAAVVPVDVHGDECLIADVATAEGNRAWSTWPSAGNDILVLNGSCKRWTDR
jgi:NAD(P)-dependent dehydrogenase (short-subunit alcohol dehydrogenase family)